MSEVETSACDRWAEIADRRLVGDAIDDEDARFASQHAAECGVCRAEAEIWDKLQAEPGDLLAADRADELVAGALEGARLRAPEANVVSLTDARRKRVLIGSAVVAALALAAAATLWIPPRSAPPLAGQPSAAISSLSGDVQIDGRAAALGSELRQGARVTTGNGRACITWGASARACLDRQSEASLADNQSSGRRVELARGTLVAALDPLPAGHSFAVSSGSSSVRVKGTVFSVMRSPDRSDVVVRVHEGVVEARADGGALRDVARRQELVLPAGTTRAVDDAVRRSELELVGIHEPPTSAPPSAQPDTPPAAVDPQPAAGKPGAHEADAGPNASDLLRQAQALRAQGNARGAAAAYRRLQALHPKSPEAAASRVSLAELLLGPLGDPAGALAAYDAYLKSGGALRQEASYGRIQALRRLGRNADERAAIEAFVRAYPNSVQARALASRLSDAAPE